MDYNMHMSCQGEGHVRISGPFSVMRIVCSNCADLELSSDTAVHSSSKIQIGGKPSVTIGSETTHRIIPLLPVIMKTIISDKNVQHERMDINQVITQEKMVMICVTTQEKMVMI